MILRRLIDTLLVLPLVIVVLYTLWALLLAPEGSCGSQAPGACFGLGIAVGVVLLPLSVVFTPILIFRIWRRARG